MLRENKHVKIKRPGGGEFSFQVFQFPLQLLAAMTIHKVQGLTLEAVIIDQLDGHGSTSQSAYVVSFLNSLKTNSI